MPLPTMNVNTSEWREKIKIHRSEILSFHSFCDDCYQIADYSSTEDYNISMGSYFALGRGAEDFLRWTQNSEGNNREQ